MIRKLRPPGVRLAIAESKFDVPHIKDRKPRPWFRCGKIDTRMVRRRGRQNEVEEAGFPTYRPWQEDLAAAVGYTEDMDAFRPSQVPIILMGANPLTWLDLHLACWSQNCTGRHVLGGAYQPKTDEFLATEEQARAIEAQGIEHLDPMSTEANIGTATRWENGKRTTVICDPLLCPWFGNPDPEKCCKPVVDFACMVTWARDETACSFKSRAWGSWSWLAWSIGDLQALLAAARSSLASAPCWLNVAQRPTAVPGSGEPIIQPAVSISLRGTLDQMALEAENRKALEQPREVRQAASIHELMAYRPTRLALEEEFTPEAHAARMSAEDAFFERFAGRISETALEAILHRTDDIDAAYEAAEAMAGGGQAPMEPEAQAATEEEPIDAEFTVEEDSAPADEVTGWLVRYRELTQGTPTDTQKAWFAEAGAEWGTRPTLAQAKALVAKAQGGGR